jgi:hypothetical protein
MRKVETSALAEMEPLRPRRLTSRSQLPEQRDQTTIRRWHGLAAGPNHVASSDRRSLNRRLHEFRNRNRQGVVFVPLPCVFAIDELAFAQEKSVVVVTGYTQISARILAAIVRATAARDD